MLRVPSGTACSTTSVRVVCPADRRRSRNTSNAFAVVRRALRALAGVRHAVESTAALRRRLPWLRADGATIPTVRECLPLDPYGDPYCARYAADADCARTTIRGNLLCGLAHAGPTPERVSACLIDGPVRSGPWLPHSSRCRSLAIARPECGGCGRDPKTDRSPKPAAHVRGAGARPDPEDSNSPGAHAGAGQLRHSPPDHDQDGDVHPPSSRGGTKLSPWY